MIISHRDRVSGVPVSSAETKGIFKKILISPSEGWEGYVMRLFELREGGHTPRHRHPWPHINFIADGEGILSLDGENHPIQGGSFAYVPGGSEHQFSNTGSQRLSIICIVPEEGEQ